MEPDRSFSRQSRMRIRSPWRMKRVSIVFFVAVMLCAPVNPAIADRATARDANDSPGPLDLRYFAHGHHRGLLTHRLGLHEDWRGRLLAGDKAWIGIWIDTSLNSPDESSERFIRINYTKARGLHAFMYDGSAPDFLRKVASVRVTRPNQRSVRIRFRASLLGETEKYEWFVETSIQRKRCGGGAIEDEGALEWGNCFDGSDRQMIHRL